MSTITNAPALANGKTLLPDDLFTRLECRIRAEHPEMTPDMPARILDQALAFLGACAVTTEPIGPSPIVDVGWHTFILYSIDYAAFCDRIAGRFIHHVPDDDGGRQLSGGQMTADCETGDCRYTNPPSLNGQAGHEGVATVSPMRGSLETTVLAIRAAGYRIDPDLWPVDASAIDCNQCHAGCHDSPTRG
ncbi:glycine-rich domain-containing protein [Actinoplanes regularis]|uniref:Uncharacterized protein n=1 Tax=Actinoplanes regularis TaxID=52697 RepID=A0A238Z4X7_9ACTN|nr:hypothetical protein [Actinoplanes regularis]GIE85833.1 hypothetical protein Are01nite_23130 [Actinoplanes regularis]SNR78447.1 hypothetical protein SAMN06264365_105445 [Actinoplanes regularis]